MKSEGENINNNDLKIIDIQYFGSIYFYLNFIYQSNIRFSSDVLYRKELHQNRMWLSGPNNLVRLSVPLAGGRNQKVQFKDLRIARADDWQRIHWRSIHDAYRKSPWFEEYAPGLEKLYQQKDDFLIDWNFRTLQWSLSTLRLKVDILADDSKRNLDPSFPDMSLPVQRPSEGHPVYQQVFSDRIGFVANLSILDLIFCEGPISKEYLKKLSAYQNPVSTII